MKAGTLGMLVAGWLGAGCAYMGTEGDGGRFEQVTLTSAVRLPARATRIHFQHGAPRSARQIVVWEPVCALVFVPASERGRMIPPGTWRVRDVRRVFDAGSWQRGVTVFGVEMRLEGGTSGPARLECEVWRTPEQVQQALTRREIEAAAGGWLRFR